MAYAKLILKNPETGSVKKAPVGFSWTTFFFGFFPAMFRGHWVGVLAILGLTIGTLGLAPLVMAFFYNKWYLKSLVEDGYKVEESSQDLDTIISKTGISLTELSPA